MTADAPASSVPCSPTPRPWTWKSGRANSSRSLGAQRHATSIAADVASRLPWLSGTPFGVPVVPDVNTSNAVSSGPATSRSGAGPAGQIDGDAGGGHAAEPSGIVQDRERRPGGGRHRADLGGPERSVDRHDHQPQAQGGDVGHGQVDRRGGADQQPVAGVQSGRRRTGPATAAVRCSSSAALSQSPSGPGSVGPAGAPAHRAAQARGSVPAATRSEAAPVKPCRRQAAAGAITSPAVTRTAPRPAEANVSVPSTSACVAPPARTG